jgi:hypothetical protein
MADKGGIKTNSSRNAEAPTKKLYNNFSTAGGLTDRNRLKK